MNFPAHEPLRGILRPCPVAPTKREPMEEVGGKPGEVVNQSQAWQLLLLFNKHKKRS